MHIARYRVPPSDQTVVGALRDGKLYALPGVTSLGHLWSLPLADIRRILEAAGEGGAGIPLEDVSLLAPVDGKTEVWASGVTYEISREARIEESDKAADVYEQVYDAKRPELFFKAAAWRVAGDGGDIGVRWDSEVNVPEPELALIVNTFGDIVGYTVCNDVSSRSIEGENPLYLPQAKVYWGSCALGPMIRPAWEVTDPYDLEIRLTIHRAGRQAWDGTANTSQLHRRYDELVSYLMAGDLHPEGVVLSTGTCLVPPAPFTLQEDDQVTIAISGVGTLTNRVLRGFEQPRTGNLSAGPERSTSSM